MKDDELTKNTSAIFANEPLTIEYIASMESKIIQRIAMRFLTPEERSNMLVSDKFGITDNNSVSESHQFFMHDRDGHDSDPHDKDPHDKDIHDRDNFDRANFDRV